MRMENILQIEFVMIVTGAIIIKRDLEQNIIELRNGEIGEDKNELLCFKNRL